MQRRSFIRKAAVGSAAGSILAAPAIVGAQPAVRWRLASSFPKSLDALYGTAEFFVKRVSDLTGGKFQISAHPAGEIVPAFQVLDAVQAGNIEIGQSAPYYYFGKDPTWAFGSAVPFGLNTRQFNAWWYQNGGEKLFNEFAAKWGVTVMLAGNTTAQMGGWVRKEIKTVEDLKGLKYRIAGLAGEVLGRLGVIAQQIPGGDLYPALEKGTIDGAEWVGPYDDEKLGLYKVAKYYYYPGWWEGCAALANFVNTKAMDGLPAEYKAALISASQEALLHMTSKFDAVNPLAIKRLIANGAQLRAFSRPILEACYKASMEVYSELNAKNPDFKKVHDSYFGAQADMVTWARVAEGTFDSFMATRTGK
ncbi:MAG: ABC transporter substrate-binding protein [Burkholderiaceae bacterium]